MLEAYLPPAADPAVDRTSGADAIAETGATSPKDMGRVMKAAMARLAGQNVDGKSVNELVREAGRCLNYFDGVRLNRVRRQKQPSHPSSLGPRQRGPFSSCYPRCTTMNPVPARGRRRRAARSAGDRRATSTSRVLGLVRDQVLAALFGAGNELDAFIVAFRIPNLVRDLFAEGAMSAAFVPTFTRHLTRSGKDDAWRLGNNVLNALVVVTALLVVLGMVFARPLVTRCTPATTRSVPGKLELTVQLDAGHAAVSDARRGRGGGDGHAQLAAPLLRAGAVAGDVQRRDDRVRVRAGAADADARPAAASWPSRSARSSAGWRRCRCSGRRCGARASAIAPIARPAAIAGLRAVLILMGPGTVGLAATQVNLFVNTLLATSQGTGAVSWLTYRASG